MVPPESPPADQRSLHQVDVLIPESLLMPLRHHKPLIIHRLTIELILNLSLPLKIKVVTWVKSRS